MEQKRILFFEAAPFLEGIEDLKRQIAAGQDLPLALHLQRSSCPDSSSTGLALSEAIFRLAPDLVILALTANGGTPVQSLFQALFESYQSPLAVAATNTNDPRAISSLLALGANDYLVPPFRAIDVWPRIRRLLELRGSKDLPAMELKEKLGLQQFVGNSPALMDQIRKIPEIARCDACVMISGETGTGKEICARAIHSLSSRAGKPFVALNSGAVPIDLVENELFGHEPGAFTSANSSRFGLIHEADGGSLFLDEIDTLSPQAQVKLLRFLQEKEYRPLGSQRTCKADVRIIAASNVDMEELLKTGKLRRDLYYRINVLPLRMPPLRERKEDIPLLARHFLVRYAEEYKRNVRDLDAGAMRKLFLHDWPGNVRELENVIARAVVLCPEPVIPCLAIDIPLEEETTPIPESFRYLKAKVVADFERGYIQELLERFQGNIAHAARAAQKNRRAFFQLMRKHRICVLRGNRGQCGDSVAIFGHQGGQKGPSPDAPGSTCFEL